MGSREQQGQIVRIKSAPDRRRTENHLLIINDFGEIRSGNFLKPLVCFLGVMALAGGVGTGLFYWFYARASEQNVQLTYSQGVFEKQAERLTRENELLMARLVVTGNAGELDALLRAGQCTGPDDNNRVPGQARPANRSGQPSDTLGEIVSIGSFAISQGSHTQDIAVRFNIRNSAKNAREISGRIFCILKPEGAASDKWVVLPRASVMKNGLPGPCEAGHYFSISRFKPVHLAINTPIPLKTFSSASVFVFDEKGDLLSRTVFDTQKDKPE